MFQAINGYFSLTHAAYASPETIMQENKTVAEWNEAFINESKKLGTYKLSDYSGYAYDAVWMLSLIHI